VICSADLRRRPRVPVVQHLFRRRCSWRHRRAGARRRARRHRRHRPAGNRAVHHGRRVRHGDGVGDPAGGVVQAPRQANFPYGAHSPPLRTQGLGRTESHRPLLDHHRGSSCCSASRPLKLRMTGTLHPQIPLARRHPRPGAGAGSHRAFGCALPGPQGSHGAGCGHAREPARRRCAACRCPRRRTADRGVQPSLLDDVAQVVISPGLSLQEAVRAGGARARIAGRG